jgi:hypothetical protein
VDEEEDDDLMEVYRPQQLKPSVETVAASLFTMRLHQLAGEQPAIEEVPVRRAAPHTRRAIHARDGVDMDPICRVASGCVEVGGEGMLIVACLCVCVAGAIAEGGGREGSGARVGMGAEHEVPQGVGGGGGEPVCQLA